MWQLSRISAFSNPSLQQDDMAFLNGAHSFSAASWTFKIMQELTLFRFHPPEHLLNLLHTFRSWDVLTNFRRLAAWCHTGTRCQGLLGACLSSSSFEFGRTTEMKIRIWVGSKRYVRLSDGEYLRYDFTYTWYPLTLLIPFNSSLYFPWHFLLYWL